MELFEQMKELLELVKDRLLNGASSLTNYKNIIKMNLELMRFIQRIIYPK